MAPFFQLMASRTSAHRPPFFLNKEEGVDGLDTKEDEDAGEGIAPSRQSRLFSVTRMQRSPQLLMGGPVLPRALRDPMRFLLSGEIPRYAALSSSGRAAPSG
jgi:hypothetical protein